jgi:hypothetical protein
VNLPFEAARWLANRGHRQAYEQLERWNDSGYPWDGRWFDPNDRLVERAIRRFGVETEDEE